MTGLRDDSLRAALAAYGHTAQDSDWGDVLARAGRERRRRIVRLAVLAAALVVVGTASALAISRSTVDFLSAKKGPHSVVVQFGMQQVIAPAGMKPGVLPHAARRITSVTVNGKAHTLYVAPTKAGGFCYLWSGFGGSCQRSRSGPDAQRVVGGGLEGSYGLSVLDGTFLRTKAVTLEATFADGQKMAIPFVWVTKPIDAGFFLYPVSTARQRKGHQVVSLALLDDSGRTLTRAKQISIPEIPDVIRHPKGFGRYIAVPPNAIYSQRALLFDLELGPHRHVGLWAAPERGGGTCYWTAIGSGCDGGTSASLVPLFRAHPELRTQAALLNLGVRGGNTPLLCCQVGTRVARVQLHYADGQRVDLTPRRGFLLYAIPKSRDARSHRLTKIVAYDQNEKVISTRPLTPDARGVYPCTKEKEKNYGYGVTACP